MYSVFQPLSINLMSATFSLHTFFSVPFLFWCAKEASLRQIFLLKDEEIDRFQWGVCGRSTSNYINKVVCVLLFVWMLNWMIRSMRMNQQALFIQSACIAFFKRYLMTPNFNLTNRHPRIMLCCEKWVNFKWFQMNKWF